MASSLGERRKGGGAGKEGRKIVGRVGRGRGGGDGSGLSKAEGGDCVGENKLLDRTLGKVGVAERPGIKVTKQRDIGNGEAGDGEGARSEKSENIAANNKQAQDHYEVSWISRMTSVFMQII